MSYAPILDASAYAEDQAGRRRSLAAASILQLLAVEDAAGLRTALEALQRSMQAEAPGLAPEQLLDLLSQWPEVEEAVAHSGVAQQEVMQELVHQLRQVMAFGQLDGGSIDDYLEPVANVIQSGRVELFAGTSARRHIHAGRAARAAASGHTRSFRR